MSHEEAKRRRRSDPEVPLPSEGWQETITVELPEPKEQLRELADRIAALTPDVPRTDSTELVRADRLR